MRRCSGVEMPILRYFFYVGGALLTLLLVSNVVLPQVPLPSTLTSASDLPPVRIHTDRKLPDRVVFDTSSTVTSAPVPVLAQAEVAQAATPVAASTAAAPEISPKARVREAFAQLPEARATEPKVASKSPPKRKVVKPRPAQPVMMFAQQPRFGQITW
jgi:hypothetical protein